MTEQITFKDPPHRRREYLKHQVIAAQLREKPGQWARVASYASSHVARHMAYLVRTARLRSYAPAGAFEATHRSEEERDWLYVRYVGEGSDA